MLNKKSSVVPAGTFQKAAANVLIQPSAPKITPPPAPSVVHQKPKGEGSHRPTVLPPTNQDKKGDAKVSIQPSVPKVTPSSTSVVHQKPKSEGSHHPRVLPPTNKDKKAAANIPLRPSTSGASVMHSHPSKKPSPAQAGKNEFEVVPAPAMLPGERYSPQPGTLFTAVCAAKKKQQAGQS